jgi:TM2 domain-containing membrane protein YozV
MAFCSKCGNSLNSNTKICWTCGNLTTSGHIPKSKRNRLSYILYGVFFGVFGAHNFYAGYNTKAVSQLLLTVLSMFCLAPFTVIWSLFDICSITKDVDGRTFS